MVGVHQKATNLYFLNPVLVSLLPFKSDKEILIYGPAGGIELLQRAIGVYHWLQFDRRG